MKILITGDSGFIGTPTSAALTERGFSVSGFSRRLGGDVRDFSAVEKAVAGNDIVFHTVADVRIDEMSSSAVSGREGMEVNVLGTQNVAFAAAKHGAHLIYASTVAVYGDAPLKHHGADDDTTIPQPIGPYAESKYIAERVVRLCEGYSMPWTILRFATTYGPHMSPALALHSFFTRALSGEDILIHGDGSQTRALLYIDDLVASVCAVCEHIDQAKNQIFNIAPKESISVRQMAEDVVATTHSSSELIFSEQRQHQIMRSSFATEKAERLLGWRAQMPWQQGLEKTYAFFQEQKD